jgi:hypothetical protein
MRSSFQGRKTMTVYVTIHTTVEDTETHHREIVPKIMEAVGRHGGKIGSKRHLPPNPQ